MPFISLIVALSAIGLSSLFMRFIVGYLVRPLDPRKKRRILPQLPPNLPRWIGRKVAEMIYRRKG